MTPPRPVRRQVAARGYKAGGPITKTKKILDTPWGLSEDTAL